MKKSKFIVFRYFIAIFLLTSSLCFAQAKTKNYFTKPLNIIVTFGKNGGTDRMTRIMAKFIEEEIKQKVNIINIKGDGTHLANNYFLKQKQDGHTMLVSAFPFYLINSINSKNTTYTLNDFSMLNLQWFDFDFLVVKKDSKYNDIHKLIKDIKTKPEKINAGIIYNSSGHLMLKVLLEKLNISQSNLNIKYYFDGNSVRKALINKEVDFAISPAKGSGKNSPKTIKALMVIKAKRDRKWDAPTLNEMLRTYGMELPILNGSMRGFAVSTKFKNEYPQRYEYLINLFRKLLAKKKVQKALRNAHIGYTWLGPKKSNKLVQKTNRFCTDYQYLIEKEEDGE